MSGSGPGQAQNHPRASSSLGHGSHEAGGLSLTVSARMPLRELINMFVESASVFSFLVFFFHLTNLFFFNLYMSGNVSPFKKLALILIGFVFYLYSKLNLTGTSYRGKPC